MFFLPHDNISTLDATDPGLAAAIACYAPLPLWGPLLGALTIAYHRRRYRRNGGADRAPCCVSYVARWLDNRRC